MPFNFFITWSVVLKLASWKLLRNFTVCVIALVKRYPVAQNDVVKVKKYLVLLKKMPIDSLLHSLFETNSRRWFFCFIFIQTSLAHNHQLLISSGMLFLDHSLSKSKTANFNINASSDNVIVLFNLTSIYSKITYSQKAATFHSWIIL